ncbi:hypothetical protein U1707_10455 [Sphingomonas sp. PB2P12]|uniref:hypothetical protein n=1 Tax=Sphingomonas sandaracina TaxID=3096157 RepID=UPI002FC96E07
MADQNARGDPGQDRGQNTDQDSGKAHKDHKGLIYAITGSILALGIMMMAFYDRAGDPMPIASVQQPVVTAQQ